MQPQDTDIPQPEKIAFIAYNVGVFESVQKFGHLITTGKVTGGMDVYRVAELLDQTAAFYDSEMISQLINSMLANAGSPNDRVTAGQVDYVIKKLKAAGVSIKSS